MKAAQTKQQEKLSSVQKAIMARDRCLLRIGGGLALAASGAALGALSIYLPVQQVKRHIELTGQMQNGDLYLSVCAGAVFGLSSYCIVLGACRAVGGVVGLLRQEGD